MSKTMENDYRKPSAIADEIERLKAELKDAYDTRTVSWLANATLRARVEELEASQNWLDFLELAAERNNLKDKVAVLEADRVWHQVVVENLKGARAENDTLRSIIAMHEPEMLRLGESEGELAQTVVELRTEVERLEAELNTANAWHVAKERDELRKKLAALQPKQPTIVKQTWQCVFKETGKFESEHDLYEVRQNLSKNFHIGQVRRDHYSDGTVKCELEEA